MITDINVQKKQIQKIEAQLAKAKENQIRTEANLEQAEKKKAEIVAQIAELGYKPEELGKAIQEKSDALSAMLKKLDNEVFPLTPSAQDQEVIF